MNLEEINILFRKYHDEREYLKFDRVIDRLSNRRDLNAFMLFDKLIPGNKCIISSSEHDTFWLSIEPEDFIPVATEDIILELVRCGVGYTEDEGFWMFS